MEVTVIEGDITTQDVDAVVNAANRRMRGGGGVDGAIHAAGGPDALEDCRTTLPGRLATGVAGWTTAGRHAGPSVHPRGRSQLDGRRARPVAADVVLPGALAVADELGARTVAFPLVSAGIYGWPRHDAIRGSGRHAALDVDLGGRGPPGRVRPAGVRRDPRRGRGLTSRRRSRS